MEGDLAGVVLKFAFLAVLYLFVIWILRGSLRAIRTGVPVESPGGPGGRSAGTDALLLVVNGGGLEPGAAYDLFGGLSIGRAADADLQIDDDFASQIHCRIYSRGGAYFVEDMQSTNGTMLNGQRVDGESELADLDVIGIGDTELRFELDLADAVGPG